jgi:PEP-CTERM motif
MSLSTTASAATNLVANGDFSSFAVGGPGISFRNTSSIATLNDWTNTASPAFNGDSNGGLIFVLASSSLADASITDTCCALSIWSQDNGGVGNVVAPPSGDADVLVQDSAPENSSYLSQTITGLTPGHTYALTFNWAAAQLYGFGGMLWNGATNEKWVANLGGTSAGLGTQAFTGGQTEQTGVVNIASHGFSGWMSAALDFTATASTEVLNLEAVSTSEGDPPLALIDDVQLSAVPEPATWAMMIVGVAGLGAIARRRRALAPA